MASRSRLPEWNFLQFGKFVWDAAGSIKALLAATSGQLLGLRNLSTRSIEDLKP